MWVKDMFEVLMFRSRWFLCCCVWPAPVSCYGEPGHDVAGRTATQADFPHPFMPQPSFLDLTAKNHLLLLQDTPLDAFTLKKTCEVLILSEENRFSMIPSCVIQLLSLYSRRRNKVCRELMKREHIALIIHVAFSCFLLLALCVFFRL